MPTRSSTIAVIGAGITGVTTAYKLTRAGYQVTLFDRHRYAAMETSFANGGQLSASNGEVWNQWSTVLKGIKWMFMPGAPLLVSPLPSWHKLSWMAEFLAAISAYERNTEATVRLAIAARAHLKQMADDEGIDFDREDRGILHVYKTRAEFAHAERVSQMLKRAGLERQAVTPGQIRDIEPALKGDFHGGFLTPSDFTGDIHKYTTQLAADCQRRGVELQYDSEITSISSDGKTSRIGLRTSGGDCNGADVLTRSFDEVVICAGVQSRQMASALGDRVNVYPVKGYSITVNLADQADRDAAPWVSLLDDDAKIVTSRLGADRFRVAGTAEFSGVNRDIRHARIAPLIAWCNRYFPQISNRGDA